MSLGLLMAYFLAKGTSSLSAIPLYVRSLQGQAPAEEDVEVLPAIQKIALEHRLRYGHADCTTYRIVAEYLSQNGTTILHPLQSFLEFTLAALLICL